MCCLPRRRRVVPDSADGVARWCISLWDRQSANKSLLTVWADSELERDQWVADLRTHAVNSNIHNAYEVDRGAKLGEGSYATVWKAKDRASGVQFALKETCKHTLRKDELDNLRDEVRIHRLVGSHDHIVYMKEFVENKDAYYLVLELVTGGELFDHIVESPGGYFTEKKAVDIMRQVMQGLAYLHSKKIAHRDMKPENIVLLHAGENPPLKIIDFGFACTVEDAHALHGLCGSPGYVAPEIIKEKGGYGLSVDMWSIGVILYILLTGIPPFTGDSDEESFALTLRGHYDKSNLADICEDGKSLVSALLTYNPAKRITAEASLNHPWFNGGAEDKALRVQENLRALTARKRLKQAIQATVATVRLPAIMRRAAARPEFKRVAGSSERNGLEVQMGGSVEEGNTEGGSDSTE